MENNDYRDSQRIPYGSMAEIRKDDVVFVCRLKDISSTGFRIDYVEYLNVNDEIEASLFFDNTKYHVKAVVMWEDVHAGVGFRITEGVELLEKNNFEPGNTQE